MENKTYRTSPKGNKENERVDRDAEYWLVNTRPETECTWLARGVLAREKSWLDRKARICGWTNTFVTIVKPETAHELSVTSRFFYLDYSWCVAFLLTIENKIGETNVSSQMSSIRLHYCKNSITCLLFVIPSFIIIYNNIIIIASIIFSMSSLWFTMINCFSSYLLLNKLHTRISHVNDSEKILWYISKYLN